LGKLNDVLLKLFSEIKKYVSNNNCLINMSEKLSLVFKGNEIEWKHPRSVDLTGVEFKALASGSHTITKDFM